MVHGTAAQLRDWLQPPQGARAMLLPLPYSLTLLACPHFLARSQASGFANALLVDVARRDFVSQLPMQVRGGHAESSA